MTSAKGSSGGSHPPARERAPRAFTERFGGDPEGIARAPGRVNLIGEHTDYNGGFVLPMAIDHEIAVAFRSIAGREAVVLSPDYEEEARFGVDSPERVEGHHWSNYVRGVASVLADSGHTVGALEAVVAGDVPQGSGLSSSAAMEVACILAFDSASGLGIEPIDQIKLAQRAENEFVGVGCGIMDQFVSRLAERDRCLRIDCRDLSYEPFPISSADVRVVVCDTGVRRKLSDGEYNERRSACERAAAKLTGRDGALLREVELERLLSAREELTEEEYSRALHVLRENERVGLVCEALSGKRYDEAGRLMYDSHESLRDLYEVSCKELDMLVDIARGVEGVCGARLTGAGFGGCTVNLVRAGAEGALAEAVTNEYPKRSGLDPEVWTFEPGPGARVEHD
ncbi:MAG: galactokinase [Planctomycetota bacterium]|jgi:galactokinase